MKPLLSLDSPLYLKRLARELNGLADGFYADGNVSIAGGAPIPYAMRFSGARLRAGKLEGKAMGFDDLWIDLTGNDTMRDAYGRAVCASRSVR